MNVTMTGGKRKVWFKHVPLMKIFLAIYERTLGAKGLGCVGIKFSAGRRATERLRVAGFAKADLFYFFLDEPESDIIGPA